MEALANYLRDEYKHKRDEEVGRERGSGVSSALPFTRGGAGGRSARVTHRHVPLAL